MRIVVADEISPEFVPPVGHQVQGQARQGSLPPRHRRPRRGLFGSRPAPRHPDREREARHRRPAPRAVGRACRSGAARRALRNGLFPSPLRGGPGWGCGRSDELPGRFHTHLQLLPARGRRARQCCFIDAASKFTDHREACHCVSHLCAGFSSRCFSSPAATPIRVRSRGWRSPIPGRRCRCAGGSRRGGPSRRRSRCAGRRNAPPGSPSACSISRARTPKPRGPSSAIPTRSSGRCASRRSPASLADHRRPPPPRRNGARLRDQPCAGRRQQASRLRRGAGSAFRRHPASRARDRRRGSGGRGDGTARRRGASWFLNDACCIRAAFALMAIRTGSDQLPGTLLP